MDPDILMAILENIKRKINNIDSEVSSIVSRIPDETDTSNIEMKLDIIIELLQTLVDKE